MLGLLLKILELQASQTATDAALVEPNLSAGRSRRQFCQTLLKMGLVFAPAVSAGRCGSQAYAQQATGGRPHGVRLLAEGVLGLGYKLRARASITPIYQLGAQQRLRAYGEVELRGPSSGQGRGDLILDASSLMLIRGRLEYVGQGITSSEPQRLTWLMDTDSGIIQENRLEGTLPLQAREHHDWVTALMLLRYLPLKDEDVIETCIWTNTEWKGPWTPQIILNNAVLRCSQDKLQGKRAIRIDGTLTPIIKPTKGPERQIRIWISDDVERQYLRGEIPWLNNTIGINIDTVRGSRWPVQSRTSWPGIRVLNAS